MKAYYEHIRIETHLTGFMSFLKKHEGGFKGSSDTFFGSVEQTKMEITQFLGVMIRAFGSAVQNE